MRLAALCSTLVASLTAIVNVQAGSGSIPVAMRHGMGRLVFVFDDTPIQSAAATSVFLDFDGKARGEPGSGADWLIEGGHVYAFEESGPSWTWAQIGDAAMSRHDGNSYMVVLPRPPGLTGNYFLRNGERFDFDINTLPLWPETCMPQSYPLDAWTSNVPDTLSSRLRDEINNASWTDYEHPWSPQWECALRDEPIPLSIELIDPGSGAASLLSGGKVLQSETTIRWLGDADGIDWNILLTRPADGGIEVTGHFVSKEERPLQVRIGLAASFTGWDWHKTLDQRLQIEDGHLPYADTADLPLNDFDFSRLPIGAISTSNLVLTVENDPDEPRLFRIEASSVFFGILYDTALTRHTAKFPGQSTFRCRFSATRLAASRRGMRAALKDFYKRHPDIYRTHLDAATWMPFPEPAINIADDAQISKLRVDSLDQTIAGQPDARRMNFLYAEPWYHWLTVDARTAQSAGESWEFVDLLATSGKSLPHQLAAATMNSCSRTLQGEPQIALIDTPLGNVRFNVCPDPDLAAVVTPKMTRAMVEAEMADLASRESGWSGVFLDSMSNLRGNDFNINALHAADYPALFDRSTGYPFVAQAFSAREWTRTLHRTLRERNQFLVGNGALDVGPWFLKDIDGYAREIRASDDGNISQLYGNDAALIRMLAGAKPVMTGLITDFSAFDARQTEDYFRNCILYGFVPGLHSADGLNGLYWRDVERVTRDAPLLGRYLMLLERLARAGWDPLPAAECRQHGLSMEAFGAGNTNIYTMLNHNTSAVTAYLELPVSRKDEIAVFPLTGETIFRTAGDSAAIEYGMMPGEVSMVVVVPRNTLSEEVSRYKADDPVHANLASIAGELALGLNAAVRYDKPIIRDRMTQIIVTFQNSGTNVLTIRNLAAMGAATQKNAVDKSFALAPGETHAAFIDLKSKDIRDDSRIQLSWDAESSGVAFSSKRIVQPSYADALELALSALSVTSVDPVASADLHVANNGSSYREIEVITSGNVLPEKVVQRISLEAGSRKTYRVLIPGDGARQQSVSVVVKDDSRTVMREVVNATFLPAGSSLLRDSRVRIQTSGTAEGYQASTLRDGVIDVSGHLWQEATWRSTGDMGKHSISISFPQPVIISDVVLFWPSDPTRTYPPSACFINAATESGEMINLGSLHPDPTEGSSRLSVDPIQVSGLEIIQPELGGSDFQPQSMWLTEIEVY